MIEFLFELVGEFLLQVFGELLVELGLRALAEPFQARPNAWFAAPAYLVFGAACGRGHTGAGRGRVAAFSFPSGAGACRASMVKAPVRPLP